MNDAVPVTVPARRFTSQASQNVKVIRKVLAVIAVTIRGIPAILIHAIDTILKTANPGSSLINISRSP
jgi:hypothetical protein